MNFLPGNRELRCGVRSGRGPDKDGRGQLRADVLERGNAAPQLQSTIPQEEDLCESMKSPTSTSR